MPRLLDLFSGRWGWSKAFAARGWDVLGVDLVEPPDRPEGCLFIEADVLGIWVESEVVHIPLNPGHALPIKPDFICASSPCEQFSVHGMKHFHPNPPYPELGIKLFEHTRRICEASGVPYIMENVRAAQQFVGNAVHHCGPFYLWGTGVPGIIPKNIWKGATQMRRDGSYRRRGGVDELMYSSKKTVRTPTLATIPPELANCVADFAQRILEQKIVQA